MQLLAIWKRKKCKEAPGGVRYLTTWHSDDNEDGVHEWHSRGTMLNADPEMLAEFENRLTEHNALERSSVSPPQRGRSAWA